MKTFWTGATGYLFGQAKLTGPAVSFRDFLAQGELPHEFFNSRKPLQLVHAAGMVGAELCENDRDESWRVNVEGTRKLLSALDTSNVKRFIYISTSHVYKPDSNPLRETSTLGPSSHYGETKLAAENLVLGLAKQMGIEVTCLRVFSVLGGATSNRGLAGLLERISTGSTEQISSSDDVRDFQTPLQYMHKIQAILKLAKLPPVINVGGGVGVSVRQAARTYLNHRGHELEEWRLTGGVSLNPRMVADISIMSQLTGIQVEHLDFSFTG